MIGWLRPGSARIGSDGKDCHYGPIVTAVPLFLDPRVIIDASLRYVAYSAGGDNVEVPSVTVLEIDWERLEDRSARVLQARRRAVVSGPEAAREVQAAIDARHPAQAAAQPAAGPCRNAERVAVVPSWRLPGGRALAVGGSTWRLLSPTALRLPPTAAEDFVALRPAKATPGDPPATDNATRSRCLALVGSGAEQPGFRSQVFEHAGRCFHITRGNPPDSGPGGGHPPAAVSPREQALVAVYERPVSGSVSTEPADAPPAPVASLSPFARLGPGDTEWLVGVRGGHAGWLAVRGQDAAGEVRLLGLP
ncbi:MAG: hypothetical protein C0505_18745 [Leptothrix sp. (in: Bacteria)]|nr:hypothetical protein [Leptothrix sp. (in: b-proteobacteria)]